MQFNLDCYCNHIEELENAVDMIALGKYDEVKFSFELIEDDCIYIKQRLKEKYNLIADISLF